jgi:hypothetical protein
MDKLSMLGIILASCTFLKLSFKSFSVESFKKPERRISS